MASVDEGNLKLQLGVNGLDNLKEALNIMAKFKENLKGLNVMLDHSKTTGIGDGLSKNFNEAHNSAQKLTSSVKDSQKATNDLKQSVKGINAELDHSKTTGIGDGLSKNFNEVHSNAERLTSSVKKLAESAGQSGNKFKEMFRKLHNGSSESNGSFGKLRDSAKKTFDEVHKGTHFLRDVVTASFISNAAISTWYSLKSGIGSALKAGEEYDKEQQVMHATWDTLTNSSVKGNRMVKAINSMSVSFGQSSGLVNELNQQFYHVLDKQGPTDRLTKSVLTMADTLGMGAENTKRLGLNFTHMMASSKMQLGDFNMISDQLPMFGSKLLAYERKAMHNSHLTMSQLRKDMSAGKISAKDAENVMNSLGKKYSKASENMMKTLPGMERVMSARGAALFGALEKPFMKAKNPIFGVISKWVSDKKTEKEFTKVGTAASKGLNVITQSFAKVFNPKKSPHLANNVMNSIAKGVTSVSNTIAHHAKSIVEFFKSLYYTVKILKDVGIGFAKGIISSLNAIVTPIGKLVGNRKRIHGFSDALKSITTHRKGLEDVGRALAGLFVAKKILNTILALRKFRSWILRVTGAEKLMDIVTAINPFVAIAVAIAAVVVGLVELYKHDKKFRKWCNGIAKSAKGLFNGITKGLSKAGKVISNIWNGIKKYTGKVTGSMWKGIKDEFNNGKKVTINSQNTFNDLIHFRWSHLGKDVSKLAGSLWKLVKEAFTDGFKVVNNLTGGRLGDMIKGFQNAWKGIGKDWHDFWNGIDKWFSNLWQGIVKHVQNGINDVIKIINDGIGEIDKAIHMFGGSSTAIGKISPVHLATGTGRQPINKPTFALLNDGHDSPETGNREMIMHANGAGELVKGTNVHKILEPGAEVFNASETKQLMEVPFAKGTGFFGGLVKGAEHIGSSIASTVGSVLSKTKKTFNLIKNIIKDPSKVLSGMFAKPKGNSTLTNDLVGGMASKVTSAASKWWSALWDMVHGGSGGDATGLLAAVEKYGRGKRYVWGAAGPSTFDCSGLVMYALKHAFGISYPHFSGAQYAKTHHISRSSAKPGDLVFWGPSKHVGVFAGGNRYWSAFAPNGHPDIGMHSISGSVPGYSPLFAKVKGLSQKTKSDKSKKSNNGLAGLIKGQVGKGFFKFVDGILSKFEDNGDMGAVGLAGDESQRAREIAKALKQAYPSATDAGIAGILGNWMQESRLSPSAIDSQDHGTGLGQWTFGRETGLRNWLKKHGYAWDSAKGQLEYALHEPGESGAFKSVLRMSSPAEAARKFFAGWESGGNEDQTGGTRTSNAEAAYKAIKGHAKGGHINRSKLSIVGEKGWELFKPDTAGTIISHDKSEKLISGKSNAKPVSIDARTYLTISSDVSDSTLKKIDRILEKRNNDLAEKRADLAGLNDADGLII